MPPGRVAALILAALATGCVSLPRPVGAWATPLALAPPRRALAGRTVGVECASGRQDVALLTPAPFVACRQIAGLLKSMGATVLTPPGLLPDEPGEGVGQAGGDDDEEDAPDFTVRYVDRGGHRDYGGWTAPLFLLSFSLFPAVEDLSATADLDLLDGDGRLYARHPLRLEIVKIYGAAALYYMVAELLPGRGRARRRQLATRLSEFVVDVVYSYDQRLAALAPARTAGP